MIARFAVALIAITVVGCSQDSPAAKFAEKTNLTRKSGSDFDLGESSYAPTSLITVGSVSGTITLEGASQATPARMSSRQPICGTDAKAQVKSGPKGGLSDAIVWIADAKWGKALPIEKRVEVSSQDCLIQPSAQATVVGAVVNFFNDDKLLHKVVFARAGTNDTLIVMPFFNDGQVVPTEKLAKTTGVVDVTCMRHPGMRGSIAVFNHPYFAVTGMDGRFKLDSLPPGTYRLMVWHKGLAKPIERKISIQTGSAGKVDVAVNLGAL